MRCPNCGAHTTCNSGRTRANGDYTRYRVCTTGHRFTTIEVVKLSRHQQLVWLEELALVAKKGRGS